MRPFLRGPIFALALLCSATAQAESLADCAGKISAEYLTARIQYQDQTRDLIVKNKPEFSALAKINRDLQVGMAKGRHAKLQYLLGSDPKRLVTGEGMSKFTNFDWSADDQKVFLQSTAEYKNLEEKIARLKEKNNDHPDWPKMRKYFREQLAPKPEYQNLQKDLFLNSDRLGEELNKCR